MAAWKADKSRNPFAMDYELFRNRVLNWVESMRLDQTQFKMNESADNTIFTSCFALFIFDLFDQIKTWSQKKRNQWVDYINSFQDRDSGYFIPENFKGKFNAKLVHQLTAFCLSALDILGASPKYDFKFLNQWSRPEDFYNYLKNKGCFKGLPGSGNMAMFQAIFLTHQYKENRTDRVIDLLNTWFYWHNKTQNPSSGFWGNSLKTKYFAGFQNAFHQFLVYNYWKRPIRYYKKIVDNVLALQDSDGFFAPNPGGGGCWDFDAADILINCGYKRGYKEEEVTRSLSLLFNAILRNQNDDGGFYESNKRPSSVKNLFSPNNLTFIFSSNNPYLFYLRLRKTLSISRRKRGKIFTHWTRKGRLWNQSDLWDTWFRCLTIAEIDKTLNLNQNINRIGWNFHNIIGLGYFRTEDHA